MRATVSLINVTTYRTGCQVQKGGGRIPPPDKPGGLLRLKIMTSQREKVLPAKLETLFDNIEAELFARGKTVAYDRVEELRRRLEERYGTVPAPIL